MINHNIVYSPLDAPYKENTVWNIKNSLDDRISLILQNSLLYSPNIIARTNELKACLSCIDYTNMDPFDQYGAGLNAIKQEIQALESFDLCFKSSILDLPQELIFHIFQFLSVADQVAAMCVCRYFRCVGEDGRLKEIRDICFGKLKWKRYFGHIGDEPIIPYEMRQALNKECVLWPGKKVKETHSIILIPQTLNGETFGLKSIWKIFKNQKEKDDKSVFWFDKNLLQLAVSGNKKSRWILITKNIIPSTLGKTKSQHEFFCIDLLTQRDIIYAVPKTLDVLTTVLTWHVDKKCLDWFECKDANSWKTLRCQESFGGLDGEDISVLVGLVRKGIIVEQAIHDDDTKAGLICYMNLSK